MLLRAAVLYVLFVIASLAAGLAVWQSLEVRLRDERLADNTRELAAARTKVQSAIDASLSADRRARIAEHDLQEFRQSRDSETQLIETLRVELAAARQQASVAETAMKETEDRLTAEIAAHAGLKAEAVDAAERAQQAVEAANAAAETARQDLAKAQVAVQPTARIEPTQAVPQLAPKPPAVSASTASVNPAPLRTVPEAAKPAIVAKPTATKPADTLPWAEPAPKKSPPTKPAAKRPVKDAAKPVKATPPLGSLF
jgi:hypothetical protein